MSCLKIKSTDATKNSESATAKYAWKDTLKIKCADTATENCPCYLAETGNCLVCSRIRGSDKCECDWAGVCVLSQFLFEGGRPSEPRVQQTADVISLKYLQPDFAVLTVSAPRRFIAQCMMPGTYIFMRNADMPHYFDTPLSILAVDIYAETLTVGVRIVSAKTTSLIEDSEKIILRGPYRNGIPRLDRRMSGKHVFIIAKGAGICPAIFAAECLKGRNDIRLAINDGPLERALCEKFLYQGARYDFVDFAGMFGDETGAVWEAAGMSDDAANTVWDLQGAICNLADEKVRCPAHEWPGCLEIQPNQVIILGCPQFTGSMLERVRPLYDAADFFTGSSQVVCCGEGVCGACGKVMTAEGPVPACKVR